VAPPALLNFLLDHRIAPEVGPWPEPGIQLGH